jgi:chemotaxis protein MotA
MFALIGIVIVIGAIIGGYLMEHGHLAVLWQPAELVIIGGAAIGTLLIANPLSVITALIKALLGVIKGSPYSKKFYLEALKMLNEIFSYARKNGLNKLEADVEEPDKSQLFSKYPALVKNHHALRLRHAAHGDCRRREPLRARSGDGSRHGGAPPRGE